MHIVIFTGGDFLSSEQTKKAIDGADLLIAADSGANTAVSLGIFPKVIIGDLDSLNPTVKAMLQKKQSTFLTSPREKDFTDTELAIQYAKSQGATSITILGGLSGDRFDHIIATLLNGVKSNIPIRFINGNQIIWSIKGPQKIQVNGNENDLLSLVPLSKTVTGITTTNLYYPLRNESLVLGKSRGVSNILTKTKATLVFAKGTLLLIHTKI